MRSPLFTLALCILGALLFLPAAQAQTPPAAASADPLEVSIVFDKEPREQGMTFLRGKGNAPGELTVDGATTPGWRAMYGSAHPETGWIRSFLFTITDPRFQNGKMPAVDIEIVFRSDAWGSVELWADTATGSRRVGSHWAGSNPRWQTLRARIDDAYFGARRHDDNPRENTSSGYDLRLNGVNNDLWIRSIKITGYDLDKNVDYARLLKLEGIGGLEDIFLFSPQAPATMNYRFRNIARRPVDTRYAVAVADLDGKLVSRKSGDFRVEGGAPSTLPFTFVTKGLPYGVYAVSLKLEEKTAAGARTILEKESYVGVASGAKLPKAKDGEFLYGLDVMLGNVSEKPRLLRWMDAMGVDIIRGFNWRHNPDDFSAERKQYEIYQRHGLRVMPMHDVAWRDSEEERRREWARAASYLERAAREFPTMRYWELGNEPDLPFFYNGPIEEYARGMAELYQGIKRGNPNTVVMNGGLSFAGSDGQTRSRRFVEVVDASRLDAWAYHGHGPGSKAERNAFERMRNTVRERGKPEKPYIETESGVAARTKAQERMQARTAIQKMVYAQSTGMPLFMWFRLLMFEEDYGNLHDPEGQGPRPAVLSYRAMVENLRGLSYTNALDLDKPETEGYVFAAKDGPGRAAVLWSNRPATHNVTLDLASRSDKLRSLRLVDMFGNSRPATVLPGGAVQVTVSEDPVFVRWETGEPAYVVKRAPSPLQTPATAQLVLGAENRITVQVRGPQRGRLDATLSVRAGGGAPVQIAPAEQKVALAAGVTKTVGFTVRLGRDAGGLRWPAQWTVFTHVDEKRVDLNSIREVPATLPGADGDRAAQRVLLRDYTVDFEKASGTRAERAPAVVFAEVFSDSDRTVKMGASADWWMEWFVNGKPVYNTLEHGNAGGYAITDHVFPIALRKGRNLLAARILSGSHGWKLLVGDPTSVYRLQNPREATPQLEITLRDGKTVLAQELVEMEYTSPIPALAELTWPGDAAQWERTEPTAALDGSNVLNFYVQEPDSSRWWRGEDDLSAQAWLRRDADRLYIAVKVRDNTHVQGEKASALWQTDSLQVALSRTGKSDFSEYAVGQVAGKTTVYKHVSAYGAPVGSMDAAAGEIVATAERHEPGVTWYRVSLDRKALGAGEFFLNLLVNDNDGGFRKQVIQWKPGLGESKEPWRWQRAAIVE